MNAELTPAYHEFVLEFAVTALLSAQACGQSLPAGFHENVAIMSRCMAIFKDQSGNIPMFGDADEGHVFILTYDDVVDPIQSLIRLGIVASGNGEGPVIKNDALSSWLLPDSQRIVDSPMLKNDAVIRETAMPDSGYFLLGNHFGTDDEIRLWVDAGHLGYLKIAAHGHADALSIYLAAFGEEILIDPGTYAYHTDKKWRDYFRGTSAHNTVRIDRQDQSLSGGNFMWLQHASVNLEDTRFGERESRVVASHDGYQRLADPVTHRRSVSFEKTSNVILVEDTIDCAGEHLAEFHWHFAEHIRIEESQDRKELCAIGRNTRATIKVDLEHLDSEIQIMKGNSEMPIGWVSRRFGKKTPAATARLAVNIKATTIVRTRIAVQRAD